MAKLVVMTGGEEGREIVLSEGLNRVGRAPGIEVRLEDPGISAVHCEIWVMRERVLVRDLDSTNGTHVDGRPVTESEMHEGGLLRVGGVEFALRDLPQDPQKVAIPRRPEPPPPPPRFTAQGVPCCVQHWEVPAAYRCRKCGEQFCLDCVRLLGRRGGERHAYCPLCHAECVSIGPPTPSARRQGTAVAGWLAKLTQTLRLRR